MQRTHAIQAALDRKGQSLPRTTSIEAALRAVRVLLACIVAGFCGSVHAESMTEYQLKAAYLYNFVTFIEWPADFGNTLTLCIYGPDPFGTDIDKFHGQNVNGRTIELVRISTADQLDSCQIVFISSEVVSNLRRVLDHTDNKPVLTIADSPGAAAGGVGLNMAMAQNKITFSVNLASVNKSGLGINFQLLRLARKVYK